MPKIKQITTTVEDEVVFMVDPQVEFVSLVKYGANRAPFKVIKNDKTKEEPNMNKVVQSVLVRNDLPDESITKALEGIDRRDEKKYNTFTAYPQVALAKIDEDSLIVQKHEEVDGIFFVLGDLGEGVGEAGTLQVDIKEAVDYATMDNLYSELYAMADVVGGAMRQENADADFRKTTILTTIDNFRAFAEVVLEKLSEKAIALGVKVSDHPDLVVDVLHATKVEKKDETSDLLGHDLTDDEKTAAAAKAKEEADAAAAAAAAGEGDDQLTLLVTSINDSLNNFGEKLIESITSSTKEVQASNAETLKVMESVTETLEKINNTTVSIKTEKEEEPDDTGIVRHKESGVFKGSFFRGMSDFR
jgi:hypothetical protein